MTFTEYLLNFALLGLVILQLRGRKLTIRALLLPLAVTAYIAYEYLHGIPTAGNDLVLEIGLASIGALLGLLAGVFTRVWQSDRGTIAKAGAVAAVFWVLGIGSRIAFSLWTSHGGAPAVGRFSAADHITSDAAWTAAFVLMAIAEVVVRTGVIFLKTRRQGIVLESGRRTALRAAA